MREQRWIGASEMIGDGRGCGREERARRVRVDTESQKTGEKEWVKSGLERCRVTLDFFQLPG